jgi:hypothetical protein
MSFMNAFSRAYRASVVFYPKALDEAVAREPARVLIDASGLRNEWLAHVPTPENNNSDAFRKEVD